MPTKKGNKWLVDERPDGARGKRIRRTFDTQGEARRFEAFILGQAAQGLPWNPTPTDRRRFSELIALWLDNHGRFLKESTRRTAILDAICADMGDPVAADMTAQDFIGYRKRKTVRGKNGAIRPAGPKTLNNHLGYCNAVFNELHRTDAITYSNPFAKIRPIKITERELSYLTPPQITELLNAAKGHNNRHLHLAVRLCLATGCRWGEMESLTRDRVKNGAVTFTDTKGKRNRTIPISADLERDLLAHDGGNRALLFLDCRSGFNRMIPRLTFKLQKGQSTHVLRHTFASHFIQNGGNILTLQRILGHQSITMTMRYSHLAPGHLEQALALNPLAGQIVDSEGAE